MTKRWLVGVIILAACGGSQSSQGGGPTPDGGVAPSPSPEFALNEFMAAVADSNLPKMAEFWGTARGSAAETGDPSDYPKRVEIMQIYLRGFTYRVQASTPVDATRSAQSMEVEMTRGDCSVSVPMTVVRTGNDRWVIQDIDLAAVGSPASPCRPG